MAKVSSMRWYGYVLTLRKEDENMIVKALKFEVGGSRGRGRPKQTWNKQVENEMRKIDWQKRMHVIQQNGEAW